MSGDLARHRLPRDGGVTVPGGLPETVGASPAPGPRRRSQDGPAGPVTSWESQGEPYSGSTAWHPSGASY